MVNREKCRHILQALTIFEIAGLDRESGLELGTAKPKLVLSVLWVGRAPEIVYLPITWKNIL